MKKIFILGLLMSVAVLADDKKTNYTDWIDCVSRLKPLNPPVGKTFKTETNRIVVLPGQGPVKGKGYRKGIFKASGEECLFYPGISAKDDELDLNAVIALSGGDDCNAKRFKDQLTTETKARLRNMNVIYEKSKLMLPASAKNDYVMSLQACFQYVPVSLKQDVVDALAQFGEKPIESDGGIPLNAHPMPDPNDSAVTK